MQQQGAAVCPPAFQQSTNGRSNRKTPYRCYENFNYCWTHGHHIEDDHTSATCTMPDPGHQHAATKMNTMGGADFGSHKTIMPSQSGRARNTNGQRPPSQSYLAWRAAGFPQPKEQFYKQFKNQRQAGQRSQQAPMMPNTMWGVNQMNNMQWSPMGQWQQQGNNGY